MCDEDTAFTKTYGTLTLKMTSQQNIKDKTHTTNTAFSRIEAPAYTSFVAFLTWPLNEGGLYLPTSMKKVLKKNSAIRDSKKGLKQDADVQCSVLPYP